MKVTRGKQLSTTLASWRDALIGPVRPFPAQGSQALCASLHRTASACRTAGAERLSHRRWPFDVLWSLVFVRSAVRPMQDPQKEPSS